MAVSGANWIRVENLEATLGDLNEAMVSVKTKTLRGLVRGGLKIQREAQKLVPVDTANLKASAFTVWEPGQPTRSPSFREGGNNTADTARLRKDHTSLVNELKSETHSKTRILFGANPIVFVGFSAYYAFYVHENSNARHTVGQSHFLKAAVHRNISKIVALVAKG